MKKDLVIILYGSTGDLTFRKVLPSLKRLMDEKKLPEKTLILAVGRRDFTDEDYFSFIEARNNNFKFDNFKKYIKYYKMQILESCDYISLNEYLNDQINNKTRLVHYMAVAANLMLDVAKNISAKGITGKNKLNHSFIFEKPFGDSLHSAKVLNDSLLDLYKEEQIYRLDHYLGKELIQELYNLRFKNTLFSSILNPRNIKSIDIEVIESDGVLDRGPFYDQTGAVKDMFQSHILQIISLLVMDEPKNEIPTEIIKEKIKALRKLKFNSDDLLFGQYNSYLSEAGVSSKSKTETMFSCKLQSKNSFRKVLINVLTGKKMSHKSTNITYTLMDGSIIIINAFPKEAIIVKSKILNNDINFEYKHQNILDEYAILINAVINKDKDKFVSKKEIEYQWKLTDAILEYKKELKIY